MEKVDFKYFLKYGANYSKNQSSDTSWAKTKTGRACIGCEIEWKREMGINKKNKK